MSIRALFVVSLSVVALSGTIAQTAQAADAKAGGALAESWCSGCHVIGTEAQTSGTDVAPTFVSVANRGDMTEDKLQTFLSEPHASAMKGIVLPRTEIDDLVAYIISLRVD